MNPVSIDIANMIEQESKLGLQQGENLFLSMEPVSPTNCVTLYDAPGGFIDSTLQAGKEDYFYEDLQIRIRDINYIEGMALARSIKAVLHGLNNFIHEATYYAFIRCTSPPFLLERDIHNRVIIIINFQIQRR